jgi:hypothetical protein
VSLRARELGSVPGPAAKMERCRPGGRHRSFVWGAHPTPTRHPVGHEPYSHSIVPGGFEVTSSTTRLTSATSLVIRVEMRSRTS